MKLFTLGCTEVGLSRTNLKVTLGKCDEKGLGLTTKCPPGDKYFNVGFKGWHWTFTLYLKRVHPTTHHGGDA